MIDELVDTTEQLRNDAQDLRRQGRDESDPEKGAVLFRAAEGEFRKAITLLERGLRTLRRTEAGYSEQVCRVLAALSRSYGSLGGTLRDAGDLDQARSNYDKGNVYEEERRKKCAAHDTYNMLQRLIIRLLIDPALLGTRGFVDDLRAVGHEIERSGRKDSWARADSALIELLCGADADAALVDMETLQAETTFYESTFNAVAALVKDGLGKGDKLGEGLESFKRLLQRKGGLA